LTGDAIIKEGSNQQWGYSAWRFAVNSSTTGAAAGEPGRILLTGDSGHYDACPTALQFNFMKQTPSTAKSFPKGSVNNVLTLIPCQQDLTRKTPMSWSPRHWSFMTRGKLNTLVLPYV